MARPTRTFLPGCAHLVIQCALDRRPVLAGDDAKKRYLDDLREVSRLHGVKLHAYLLGDDSAQILLTPEDGAQLSRMMQALGRRFVAWLNHRDQRRGTIWEGRFMACPLLTPHFVLSAQRALESGGLATGPVLAFGTSMVHGSAQPWSSAGHHLGRKSDLTLESHPAYWGMGNTPFEREARYREFLEEGPSRKELETLMAAARAGRPLADEDSLRHWEKRLGLVLQRRPRGRPPKQAGVPA